ncbi:MAG: 6-carboxytetrahydropterin synthase [Bacteroidetes bacterium]|nr:6-carboxytetrahydropterin synthase [Bacteroidota bacterium]
MGKEKVTLTKIFTFDAAHVLENYPGKCKYIHGHTYHLHVTISGEIRDEMNHPYNGMIIDFTDLKRWVQESVLNLFDHALLLYKNSITAKIDFPQKERIYLTKYTPTCENMLLDIVERLKHSAPNNIYLTEVNLQETPTAIATWKA